MTMETERELLEAVVGLRQDMKNVIVSLGEIKMDLKTQNGRVRHLEIGQGKILGAAVTVATLMPVVLFFLSKLFLK